MGCDALRIVIMHKYPLSEIERFKREAKRLQRAETLRLADALDRVALTRGFNNWSLLMKRRAADVNTSQPPPYIYSRSAEALSEALRLVPPPRYGNRSDSDLARDRVEDICARFVSSTNAVDFAIAFMQALLALRRYRVAHATQAQWEMRCWLPYGAHRLDEAAGTQILVNRLYKPVGQVSDEFAHYDRFSHLHLALSAAQLDAISARAGGEGFLYNDGCLPWRSRAHAEVYLGRLRRLRATLGH